jgi:hypothetical protein
MNFRHLGEPLRPLAEAVVRYFRDERGIRGFVEEESIHQEVARPTLHAAATDFHFWCVEFSETTPYPPTLDRLVLDCVRLGLPVKLFVALPSGISSAEHQRDLARARACGVGVIEVADGEAHVTNEPISLSLAGVRQIEKNKFPAKYRLPLTRAESTFRQGNPTKGCSEVYDQIESLTRRIAKRTKALGYWSASKSGNPLPRTDLDKVSWARVIGLLMDQLDPRHPPQIPVALLARILGVTPHRNDAGHDPASQDRLVRRDREAKTRFETAVDLLRELIVAARPLKV